jgi:GAF domain
MRQAADNGLFAGVDRICDAAMEQTNADGVALAVLTRSRRVRELIYASDPIARQLDDLQYMIGEGPCFDAYLEDDPKFYPELSDVARTSRWPTFAYEATRVGAQALFAFPVPNGDRPTGVLQLYRRNTGGLTDPERSSAKSCATAIAQQLESNWQDHVSRFPTTEEAIDATAIAGASEHEPADSFTRTQIHVAGGMVAVQLRVRAEEGVDRLRAFAYACGRSLSSVAADIIARRLTLRDQDDR